MATLVLGTVGRIFGGPLGGLVGTFLGGAVDRAVLGGGGKPREVGRIGNLAVQSAAYGEPIPFIAGRMRSAGNLIWTSGIAETATRNGGGKRSGPATTSYSYSASFAVALAGCEIVGIERIWADGKLIRDAAGVFTTPVTMRLHHGSEGQDTDPLIAAAEGAGGTPAYRGIAYAVFEDLPLGDYGNRIPNLTFEVVADPDGSDITATALARLGAIDGHGLVMPDGAFPVVAGHYFGRAGSLSEALAPLIGMANASVVDGTPIVIRSTGAAVMPVPGADCDTASAADTTPRERRKRAGGDSITSAVEVAFYDTSRDYQIGVQRVRRGGASRIDQQSFAAAMTPQQAKTLAAMLLTSARAARTTASVRLPWRYLAIAVGGLVQLGEDPAVWRVREVRFERFVLTLDVERVDVSTQPLVAGDGGRALVFDDAAAGPTHLELLDLPPLPGDVPGLPRLWIAGAGASAGWRRALVEASSDAGASYAAIGLVEGGVPQGVATTTLVPGPFDLWDRHASVEVTLLSAAMWLEPRSEASVLAGGNMALVGSEIIQFANADALASGRFRLSGLLRGRRGTEAAIAGHGEDERFVLLDTAALLPFDPPIEAIGRDYRFRPVGPGDLATPPIAGMAGGRALRPLAPVHLRLFDLGGEVRARWVRRSRAGFGWSDFVDAPLGEAGEAYRVVVALDGRTARTVTVTKSEFTYSAADRSSDGGGTAIAISVAQLSEAIGPGDFATASIALT